MQTQAKRRTVVTVPPIVPGQVSAGRHCPAKEKKKRMSLAEKTAIICILTISAIAGLTGYQTQTGEVFPASATGHMPGILASADTINVAFTSAPDLSPILKRMPVPVLYVSPGDMIYVRPKFISF